MIKELAKSCNVSRYIAKASDVYDAHILEEFKRLLDKKDYKREILLELEDEPFDLFF